LITKIQKSDYTDFLQVLLGCGPLEDRKTEISPFCLLVVANLDFNSLMGKVGGWKALSREWFDG
jgi:hypothetical protein